MTGGREGLIDSDVDGSELRTLHTSEVEQMRCVVDDCDVHGHSDFFGALFGSGQRDARSFERERRYGLYRHRE